MNDQEKISALLDWIETNFQDQPFGLEIGTSETVIRETQKHLSHRGILHYRFTVGGRYHRLYLGVTDQTFPDYPHLRLLPLHQFTRCRCGDVWLWNTEKNDPILRGRDVECDRCSQETQIDELENDFLSLNASDSEEEVQEIDLAEYLSD